ncbi:MAG: hypothetical protein L6R36_005510 [Xanthoria steineri]|nr:MAG: hypothetical protein L6R36_005510 [Xanthoria steineri]
MSDAIYTNFISAQHLKDLSYCMIALATCFAVIRVAIRAWKGRFWLTEDVTVCLAWTCFIAMTIGYICVTDTLYRVSEVGNSAMPPYEGFQDDTVFVLKIFFPNTLLLWTTLWLVKLALLLQCRRLIDRRPHCLVVWWVIVGLTSLFYVGCVVSEFTSCHSLHAWFTFAQCSTERDTRASTVSLFYAFAVDIVTDLMIMIFPLRILWSLRLSRVRKVSIMAVFGVGIICIITSIVRVTNIHKRAHASQPAPSWLILWAVIEAAIAVVVACMPTFGLLLPSQTTDPANGLPSSTPHLKIGHRERMQKNGMVLQSRGSQHGFQGPIIEGNASREKLKSMDANFSPNGVLVTTTLNVGARVDGGLTDMDEDSTHKGSLPEYHLGQMV